MTSAVALEGTATTKQTSQDTGNILGRLISGRLSLPANNLGQFRAMHMGEQSLKLEIARRHAPTPEASALVTAPPAATWVFNKLS